LERTGGTVECCVWAVKAGWFRLGCGVSVVALVGHCEELVVEGGQWAGTCLGDLTQVKESAAAR
jgi:hypothetical protein